MLQRSLKCWQNMTRNVEKQCCNIFEKYLNIFNWIVLKWAGGKNKKYIFRWTFVSWKFVLLSTFH
jgi:hypothetical protein